jgi:Concanavalin A-like lectin/glucanases superfamily/HYR domain
MISGEVIMTKRILLAVGAFAAVFVVAFSVRTPHASGNILCVNPGGTGGCFASIQAAIDAATDDDVINVLPGTYSENVILNKRLTINGRQAGVDGRGRVVGPPDTSIESVLTAASGTLIELTTGAAGSVIDGMVLSGGTTGVGSSSGPLDGLHLLNNVIIGFTGNGVFLANDAMDVTIEQNEIDGSSAGSGGLVDFDVDDFDGLNLVNNNIINGSTATGFFCDGNHNIGVSSTRPPLIKGNLISGLSVGMNLGRFAFEFGEISLNTFTNNSFDGLQGGIQNSTIQGNKFTGNGRSGISLTGFGGAGDATRGAQDNVIQCNTFTGNGFTNDGEAVFFSSGQFPGTIATNQVIGNNISGNNRGATYAGSETIDAENNWWGSATGPTHPSNPGGTGDTISDGPGVIDFMPFLTAAIPDTNGDGLLDSCEPHCATPPANMISWWTGDSTADDLLGANNGSAENGATFTDGKVDEAFSLDGDDDFIAVPDAASLNFGTGNLSIDAWVLTSNAMGIQGIVDKRAEPSAGVFTGYALFTSDGNLGFQLGDGVSTTDFASMKNVADGEFHHVAVTLDRTSAAGGRLYVDGVVALTFDPTGVTGSATNAVELRIGKSSDNIAAVLGQFAGLIDEVEIFDRALTSIEVRSIFNADTLGKCKCIITCPADISVPVDTGECTAVVDFDPTNNGRCSNIVCSPPAGSAFPTGTTTVTCTADDGSNCSFDVTVSDSEPPTIMCPADIDIGNDPGQCGATVAFDPSASDVCSAVTVECTPASGSFFDVGTTPVSCTATDASNNSATCGFNVTVNDTEPPTITCPANRRVVSPDASSPVTVNFAPGVMDNCAGVGVVCTPPSGSPFPLGDTMVTCTATDASMNTAGCSFTVTVSPFDICLQDDSRASSVLQFNSMSGNYQFCCGTMVFTGKGTVLKSGNIVALTHNAPDRRLTARVDLASKRASASLQSPPGVVKCTITDRNITNNACQCSVP